MKMTLLVRSMVLAPALAFSLCSISRTFAQEPAAPIGDFESHGDIGTVLHPGTAEHDAAKKTYTLSGSGENMWFEKDAFQFVWKKMSGDVKIAAEIAFIGAGGNPHRKAVLMIRQSLDADSIYADIARHGNGMTAIQFRTEKAGLTREVQSPNWNPVRLRIEKHGDYFTMWLAGDDGELRAGAASPKIALKEPFYVGIGVCSHDPNVTERAIFSNVELASKPTTPLTATNSTLYSFLETTPVDSGDRTALYVSQGRFEAPNWSRDGKSLYFNRDGRLLHLPLDAKMAREPSTPESPTRCNNDHGISPDGRAGHQRPVAGRSQVARFTSMPHGRRIRHDASRRNRRRTGTAGRPTERRWPSSASATANSTSTRFPSTGGEETRLTTAKGLDDGPEYSPDGQYIYFNSERTGTCRSGA